MAGLEWSTGSSTQWVLMRVKSLISIEHHAKWSKARVLVHAFRASFLLECISFSFAEEWRWMLQSVAEAMEKIFGKTDLEAQWKLHAIEPLPG